MVAALKGIDVLVFTAGIGENASPLRERVCDTFSFLGMHLDKKINSLASSKDQDISKDQVISAKDSKTQVLVIHTQEAFEIARECWHKISHEEIEQPMDKYLITKEDAQKKECDLLFKELGASKEGLSAAEAAARLPRADPIRLKKSAPPSFSQYCIIFGDPIPWMIEIAGILSLIVRQYADFYIILILLHVNGMVDFWEEFQAGNAIKALKKKLAPKCMVKRNGSWLEIDAMQLVPGRHYKLRLGNIIPADAKLFEGDYLTVDQSTLNGRVASRYEKNQRPGFFRIHYKTRRNDRSCDCNGR